VAVAELLPLRRNRYAPGHAHPYAAG
jgi:hypothetical protein